MHLTIKNLRGIKSATIDLSGIALVAGLNGSGKSSIAVAAAACLMGTASPLPGMLAKDARLLLRDDSQRGSASLLDTTVNWPGGTVTPDGKRYSAIVAGMQSLATMPAKERLPWIIAELKAEPTIDDLRATLAEILPAKGIDAVCQSVTESGWDGALARAKDNGTKAKGAWEHVTGERYGSQKATTWQPAGITSTDGQALERDVAEFTRQYHDAIKSSAITRAEMEQLQALCTLERIAAEESATLRAEAPLPAAEAAEKAAAQTLERTPRPGAPQITAACPDCGSSLVVVSATELRHAAAAPVADAGAYSAACDAHLAALKALRGVREAIAESRRRLNACYDAQDRMKNHSEADPELSERLRGQMENAQQALVLCNRMIDASRQHQAVLRAEQIAAVLSPDGLRRDAMVSAIERMNAELAELSARAGFPAVAVSDDGSVSAMGRPYALLSEGEKFRARVVLQLWQARREDAPLVVVDAADLLDAPGRNGLFRALSGRRALVTMTYSKPEDVLQPRPGLAVYWLENGEAVKKEAGTKPA